MDDDWLVKIVAKCATCGEPRCYDLPPDGPARWMKSSGSSGRSR